MAQKTRKPRPVRIEIVPARKKRRRKTVRTEPQLRVTSEHVAAAQARYSRPKGVGRDGVAAITAKDLFRPYPPAPGVLPRGEQPLAFDEAISDFSPWGASYFASAVAEGQTFLGYPFLSELLQRGEYRRMVETVAVQMTRKWIRITSKSEQGDTEGVEDEMQEKISRIEDEFARLDVRGVFQRAALYEEGMGRSHVGLDTGDDNNPDEMITDIGDGRDAASRGKISPRHPLRRLVNVEPTWTYPSNYNSTNPLDPSWYRPDEWYVLARRVHASRLLTFVGRPVPDMLKPAYSFGGLSLVQMAKPYVDNWLRTRQSVSDIVNAYSTFVLQTNMSQVLQPGGSAANLFNRLDMFNITRNNAGVMAIDKATEGFENVAAPLGTLDALQSQTQEHMAAISAIPIVFLLGITPQGLNASSEGEIRVFYDWIHSYQELLFRPNLTRVLNFVQLSLFGEVDPSIGFEFEPLWSSTEKELAELRKIEAETDQIDIDKGVLHPEERRQRITRDPSSPYSGLNPDDVPDLLEEEEQGLEPHGSAAKIGEAKAEEDQDSDEDDGDALSRLAGGDR